jgi:hypothetical protein
MQITTAWLRAPDDHGVRFENEIRILFPDERIFPVRNEEIEFVSEIHRSVTKLFAMFPMTGGGMLRVQNRLRPIGAEQWIEQEFPLLIIDVTPQPEAN